MIELRGITRSASLPDGRRLDILKGVDLFISPGESVAILGRSGSGKSTLLNIIGLLDQADGGSYILDGQDVSKLGDRAKSRLRGSTFGFVFQNFMLFERRSAAHNVSIPLLYGGAPDYRSRGPLALDRLRSVGLTRQASVLPNRLSGGEQQRVAIARAMVRDPTYLLADEPTGSLDVDTAASILELLLQVVRTARRALVVITHDPQVSALADRRFALTDGRLVPQ